jgi:hypothetical protein
VEEPDLEELKRTDDVLLRLFGVAMDARHEKAIDAYADARLYLRQFTYQRYNVHIEDA